MVASRRGVAECLHALPHWPPGSHMIHTLGPTWSSSEANRHFDFLCDMHEITPTEVLRNCGLFEPLASLPGATQIQDAQYLDLQVAFKHELICIRTPTTGSLPFSFFGSHVFSFLEREWKPAPSECKKLIRYWRGAEISAVLNGRLSTDPGALTCKGQSVMNLHQLHDTPRSWHDPTRLPMTICWSPVHLDHDYDTESRNDWIEEARDVAQLWLRHKKQRSQDIGVRRRAASEPRRTRSYHTAKRRILISSTVMAVLIDQSACYLNASSDTLNSATAATITPTTAEGAFMSPANGLLYAQGLSKISRRNTENGQCSVE
ncbi:hypothetical protein AC579_1399 [Pseudocercospora musae]|uniref:Uncharacterized protein n=1 Tax=Pseudocercospora musae TaxID=113226 RepID=A0A139IFP5_9PEZI|nr:hypothetical protein AC579_1399 [Pseudocercospora musae]